VSVNLEKDLNQEQKRAAEMLEGPVLILAGAGAGKTRVLTYKIAHMIEKGISPDSIIALTFTNKAAGEMQDRVNDLLDSKYRIWISTFHSACSRILREHIDVLGYDLTFTIFDDTDSLTLVKQVMKKLQISEKTVKPQSLRAWIGDAKNRNLNPEEFPSEAYGYPGKKAAEVYREYQKELKKNNAVDFGDLLMLVLELFKKNEILSSYTDRLKYILIDEYQDTNRVQYLFLKKLTQNTSNISVVGDEDQSIYGWRGADINNILNFSKNYREVKVVKLEQNYRSTQNILSAAGEVVKNNKNRIGKTVWTSSGEGEKIALFEEETDRKEAHRVVEEARMLHGGKNLNYSEMAIFYRTNAQSRVFEESLRKNNIRYRIYGGLKFYDRAEIKDVTAYLRVIVNPADNISLRRILGLTAGIGKTTIDSITREADAKNVSVFELLEAGWMESVRPAAQKKLCKFLERIKLFKQVSENFPLSALYDEITENTGYIRNLERERTIEAMSKIENLFQLRASLREFEVAHENPTLYNYLDQVSLLTNADEQYAGNSDDQIVLMTLHMSKGLEFEAVFIVGLEEKLLPHSRSDFSSSELEEERRLLYVGMTRAKRLLYLSNARMRDVYGKPQYSIPSRFLEEIPERFIKRFSNRAFFTSTMEHRETDRRFHGELSNNRSNDSQIIYDNPSDQYRKGMNVSHRVFGRGRVVRVEGSGDGANIVVQFNGGPKRLKIKYASLEII